MESNWNQGKNNIINHQLGCLLEDNGLALNMQYGLQPDKLCLSVALNTQLAYDLVHLTKTTAAFIKNDDVGCYDPLVNNLFFLLKRQLDLPQSDINSVGVTWANTVHLVKTTYGTLEN